MTLASSTRVLQIEGTYNFRDLGGYPAAGGRTTRWRTLFRSDSLHRLTPSGKSRFLELGVQTIVDLRYPTECAQYPCGVSASAIGYQSIPLFENPQRPPDGSVPHMDAIYRMMVDTRQTQIAAAVHALATGDVFPAVINCTAGKDRTGVVVALVLELLGVERHAIVADFAMSRDLLRASPLGDEVRARIAARGGDPAQAERLLISPPEHMLELLDYVDSRYGGAEALLLNAGLPPERITALRRALLE